LGEIQHRLTKLFHGQPVENGDLRSDFKEKNPA
jgi:hypothetical protein